MRRLLVWKLVVLLFLTSFGVCLAFERNQEKAQKNVVVVAIKPATYKVVRASWYGKPFHGKKRADGKIYNMYSTLVAHKTLPLGAKVRLTNLKNNRSIITHVRDRGPYIQGRELDLSLGAASKLKAVKDGVVLVKMEVL